MIRSSIIDGFGNQRAANVVALGEAFKDHNSLLVCTSPFLTFDTKVIPFTNPVNGVAMNKDASVGGTPEIIHNGGTSTEWTGVAGQGTWNFADSDKVSLTNGNNNDNAVFSEETPTTVDLSGFVSISGKINLTTYTSANTVIRVQFDNAAVNVGNSVNIDDYINPDLLAVEQSFVIPKVDMGLDTQSVDGFTITVIRIGGTKPTFTLDDIEIDQTGSPVVYTAAPIAGERFYVHEIRYTLADVLALTVTNGTAPGLAYNKILNESELTNGIEVSRTQKNIIQFSLRIKSM